MMEEGRLYVARSDRYLERWLRDGGLGIDREYWPGGLVSVSAGKRLGCCGVFRDGTVEFVLSSGTYLRDTDPTGGWTEITSTGQLTLGV